MPLPITEPTDLDVDVVVIGAGHNSLIAAGYLAKAGLEVAVLEAKPIIGGNTVTEELTLAGWMHDSCSSAHAVIQSNPVLRDDELDLKSRYGLRYVYTEPASVLPLDDGQSLVLHRSVSDTAEELARFSRRDADRLVEMLDAWKILKIAHGAWNAGRRLQDVDAQRAYDALRQRSAWEVIHSNFEHEVSRRLLSWMGFANFQPPTRAGTGMLPISILAGRIEYGWATPLGGSGAIATALEAQITDHGGRVLRDAPVSRVLVEGGRAAAVETSDGRRVSARTGIVSSAHLTTLPEMIGSAVTPDLVQARAAWRPGLPLFAVHAALKDDVRYAVGHNKIQSVAGGLGSPEGTVRQVEGIANGRAEMQDPWMLMVSSTVVDPDRAPGGTFKILTCAPYTLNDGRTWNDFGDEYAQHLLSLAGRHVEGLADSDILSVLPETPSSLAERNLHNISGSCHGGEFELLTGEVIPGWTQIRSDLPGLFLTGATAHPGGSVSGWPGRNAAEAVLESIGVNPSTAMAASSQQ